MQFGAKKRKCCVKVKHSLRPPIEEALKATFSGEVGIYCCSMFFKRSLLREFQLFNNAQASILIRGSLSFGPIIRG